MCFLLYDLVDWCSQANGSATGKTGQIVQVVAAGQLPDRSQFASLYAGKGVGKARDGESYVVCVEGRRVYWPRSSCLRPSSTRQAQQRAMRQWAGLCHESLWHAQERARLLEEFVASRNLLGELMVFAKKRAGYAHDFGAPALAHGEPNLTAVESLR